MTTTNRIRLYDPAAKRAAPRVDRREYPQDFYVARGLAKLLSDIGRREEAAEAMELAKQAKREVA